MKGNPMDERMDEATAAVLAESNRKALGNEFTLYLSMAVRCAAQVWQLEDDADLAMRVLTRAVYAPDHMPVLDGAELIGKSVEIARYIEENPLPPCEICSNESVAVIDGISYCWKHYSSTLFTQFTQQVLDKKAELQTGDGTTT